MWLKEPPQSLNSSLYSAVKDRMYKLNFLFKENNVYIMDNHLAAGYSWLDLLDPQESYNFFHIDQHEDLLAAGYETMQPLRDNPNVTIEEYLGLLNHSGALPLFSWDNYIHNIKDIYPNWFTECFFACEFHVSDNRPNGRGLNITRNFNFINNPDDSIFDIISNTELKWIINLDIDYFWNVENGTYIQLLNNEQISQFCDNLISAMDNIAIITIALSPSCCGGWNNSYQVAKLITDKLGVDFFLNNMG